MNLDKIETQEEKEAFEGMANSSEVPNSSEWDGVNGFSFCFEDGKLVEINIPQGFKDGILKVSNRKIEILQ